jgi:hypothetical protein
MINTSDLIISKIIFGEMRSSIGAKGVFVWASGSFPEK